MTEKETRFTLTGNDIALAQEAAAFAINSYERYERPFTDFVIERIAAHKALLSKLNAVSEYAYPYGSSDDMPADCGDEPIMTIDHAVTAETREIAAKGTGEPL